MSKIDWRHEVLFSMLNSQSKKGAACMCLSGEPGVGKSHFMKEFGKAWIENFDPKKHYIEYQCHEDTQASDFLIDFDAAKLVDAVSSRGIHTGLDGMVEGIGLQALKRSQSHPVVLGIDELDKARPNFQPMLLKYLEDLTIEIPLLGRVKGVKKNIAIIITANFDNEFNEALARRWVRIILPFPEKRELTAQITSMLGETQYALIGESKVKHMVDFTYKFRNYETEKKLVGNQIVRLLEFLLHCKMAGDKKAFEEGILWHISDSPKDWNIITQVTPIKHLVNHLWA